MCFKILRNITYFFDIRSGINIMSNEVVILENLLLKKLKFLYAVIHTESPKPMDAI